MVASPPQWDYRRLVNAAQIAMARTGATRLVTHDAEDYVQQALLEVLARRGSLDGVNTSYLAQQARWQVLTAMRLLARVADSLAAPLAGDDSFTLGDLLHGADDPVAALLLAEEVCEVLDFLASDAGGALVVAGALGWEQDELVGQDGAETRNAITKRVQKARARLRAWRREREAAAWGEPPEAARHPARRGDE